MGTARLLFFLSHFIYLSVSVLTRTIYLTGGNKPETVAMIDQMVLHFNLSLLQFKMIVITGVLFMNEGRMKRDIVDQVDRCSGQCNALRCGAGR